MGRVNHEPCRYRPQAFQALLDLEYRFYFLLNTNKSQQKISIKNKFR